ncbi:MAG: hemolysin [Colwellia sp.]|nr:MAG: hemolysin [Colwellia sp.]
MSNSQIENTSRSIASSTENKPLSHISLAAFSPNTTLGKVLNFFAPVLDSLLGIKKLNRLYLEQKFSGLDKQDFSEKLLAALGVSILSTDKVLTKIPKTGKCIVICNHPYGMVEGVIIAKILTDYRNDTKVMANIALQVFTEINNYFIFANPLKPQAAINSTAIKQCYRHVENDGLLVIFPAGRVSFYQSEHKIITDGNWNRLAVNIAEKTQAPILPIFISGTNSTLFHRLGRIYYRFRLLMLAREMFKLQNHKITLSANNLITPKQLRVFNNSEMKNNLLRLQCYLNDQQYFQPWPQDEIKTSFSPVAEKTEYNLIEAELDKLPKKQHLLTFKYYVVYYGYQTQIPNCVKEIARLRELTFRDLDEGSGEPYDTDTFDATYMHLFIYDNNNKQITGAYRIGQTDRLQKQNGLAQLYLSQMFNFNKDFISQQEPCLEMGRSFIITREQKSYHSLLLLWKGIGAYVCQNPRYRTFYGTVSLSKQYDPRSVAIIEKMMVKASAGVTAKTAFTGQLHPEVTQFIENNTVELDELSVIISAIEKDGKGIPVLLKQYHKLGANFHCMAIDTNFNQTPGLLLSVHFPSAPQKLLKLYLGDNKTEYLAYKE